MSVDQRHYFTDEELKKHDAAVRLELLNTMSEFTGHVAEIRPTEFALQHPWKCRPDLLGCEVNQALHALPGPPAEPGWYECRMVDHGEGDVLEIGDPVEPGTDPLFAYLLERYPED